jgi:hypothetical protein
MLMLRLAAFLAILLALPLLSFAQETPQLASSLSAEIEVHGTVTASGGSIHSLEMNISVPTTTSYQAVDVGEQVQKDSNGNGFLSISAQNPANPFAYTKMISVQATSRSTPFLPESYIVPSQYGVFTLSTNRTQSNDSSLQQLAQQITYGAQTPFEKVARLAIFVNKNMDYQESMVGEEKDAVWVSQNMRGVCTEYSTLFAALARSINIPVRYLSGYVYSDKFSSWMGHAWTEAYLGEWVPVDPTWFEVGALDAMHIEESKSSEFSHRDSLSASVSNSNVGLDWDTGEKNGAVAGNIKTLDSGQSLPRTDFEIGTADATLPFGGSTIVYFSMNGTGYQVIPVSLVNCAGTESVLLPESSKYLVLAPGKESTLTWTIDASRTLSQGYIYTCPLTLNSPYLKRRTISIGIDPTKFKIPLLEASLRKSSILPGQDNAVLINVPLQLRGNKFVAVLPDGVYSAVANGATVEIPFNSSATGNVSVYVSGEGGGEVLLGYYSGALLANKVAIDGFSLPEFLLKGKMARAQVNVSAAAYPSDVALDFYFGSEAKKAAGRIIAPTSFAIEFTPNEPGTFTARLAASSPGGKDEENRLASVIMPPSVSIGSVQNIYSNGTLYTKVAFLQTGQVVSPFASVAGSAYAVSPSLTLVLPLGQQTVGLAWQDGAGNNYSSTEQIIVAYPTLLSSVPQPPGCPIALLAVSAVFMLIIFKRRGG